MTKTVYGLAIECQDGFELFEDKADAVAAYAVEKAKTIAEFNVWNDECVYLYELEIHSQDNTDDLCWFDFRDDGRRIDVKEGLCGSHIEEVLIMKSNYKYIVIEPKIQEDINDE